MLPESGFCSVIHNSLGRGVLLPGLHDGIVRREDGNVGNQRIHIVARHEIVDLIGVQAVLLCDHTG